MARSILFTLLVILVLSSCARVNKKLTITTYSLGSDSHNAALAIKKVLKEEGWQLNIVTQPHQIGVEALRNGEVDLAITSNDISIESKGLRTIIPLYSEVITTLVKENSPLRNVEALEDVYSLMKDTDLKIMFSNQGSYSHLFAKRLLEIQGISDQEYSAVYFPVLDTYNKGKLTAVQSENPDYIFIVGSTDSHIIDEIMEEDYIIENKQNQVANVESGYVASFAAKMVRSFPVVIPAHSYSSRQSEPLVTLGLFCSLISSKNLDDETAYALVKDLMRVQPDLIQENSNFFDMSEGFDRRYLNYQVHPGADSYFDRDKPGFLERYAELSGVLFSMFVVTITFLASMNRVRKQRKKDRIDIFYADAQKIRHEDPAIGLEHLRALEDKAFEQLISEHLSGDASFVVFMQLVSEVKNELKEQLTKTLIPKKDA